MPKRMQYDILVQGISNAQAVERPQLDKWLSNTANTPPLANWARAQLNAFHPALSADSDNGFSGSSNTFAVERTQADKWQPLTNQPPNTISRLAHLAQQASVAPGVIAEIITVNKWHSEVARPRWDITRTAHLAPVLVDPVSPTFTERAQIDKWISTYPDFARGAERQQHLAPTPAVAPISTTFTERAQVDKWFTETSKPRFDVPKLPHLAQTFIGPITTVFTEQAQVDKWFAETGRPRFDVTKLPHLAPHSASPISPTFAETTKVDKWFVETGRPRFDVAKLPHLAQTFINPVTTLFTERAQIDKWVATYADFTRDAAQTQYLDPAQAQDTLTLPTRNEFIEHLTPGQSLPIWAAARTQYLHPAQVQDAAALTRVERAQVDKWTPRYPDSTRGAERQQYLDPAPTFGPTSPTFAETAQLDKWFVETGRPRFDVVKAPHLAPVFGAPVSPTFTERAQVDKWQPTFADRVFGASRLPHLAPAPSSGPISTAFAETTAVDKWFAETAKPRFDVQRLPHLAQVAVQPTNTVFTEAAQLDKWAPNLPDQTRTALRAQHLAPVKAFDPYPRPPVAGTIVDAWYQETAKPRFEVQRLPHLAPTETGPVSPTFAERTQIDKWSAVYPDIVRTAERLQHLSAVLAFHPYPLPTVPGTRLDAWYVETAKPRFDITRLPHLAPVFTSAVDTVYTERAQIDKWANTYPDRVERPATPFLHVLTPFVPIRAETITVDKWFKETGQPRTDVARLPHLHPAQAQPVTTTYAEQAQIDKWLPLFPNQVRAALNRAYLSPAGAQDTLPRVAVSFQWWTPIVQPGPFGENTAYLKTSYHGALTPPFVPLDRWFVETQRPPAGAAPRAWSDPERGVDPVSPRAADITMDRWFAETSSPVRAVARLTWLYHPAWSLPATLFIAPPATTRPSASFLQVGRPAASFTRIGAPVAFVSPVGRPTSSFGAVPAPTASILAAGSPSTTILEG